MYAKKLSIYGFRCFGKAVLDLQFPGRHTDVPLEMPNVNLIVGDNGRGKSSVLRAIAIAALAPALMDSGFVPYRLVRRPGKKSSLLKLVCELDPDDLIEPSLDSQKTIELLARIDRRDRGSLDRLHLDKTPDSPIERLIFDDYSHAFFVVGYGATRRTETGDFVGSSSRKARGLRYQRVAGLFEDHVALRPLQSWLPRVKSKQRRQEAIRKLSSILPPHISFDGRFDESEEQYVFSFDGEPTPFTALSDGYKAFLSWAGDLIGNLCDVAPPKVAIDAFSGIVLIDEIDLHLHPAWQRTVVSTLSSAFPRLQFVTTSHSPLIANTLRKENIFLTETAEDGSATIKQIEESVHGRGADQLLLSSYFGLQSTLPPTLETHSKSLFSKAAEGDSKAALAFIEQLSATPDTKLELVPAIASALRDTNKLRPNQKKGLSGRRLTIRARRQKRAAKKKRRK